MMVDTQKLRLSFRALQRLTGSPAQIAAIKWAITQTYTLDKTRAKSFHPPEPTL